MSWIDECSIERRTMYSNGLLVLTDDCKRIDELINRMKDKFPEPLLIKLKDEQKRWIPERWLILDGWEGLLLYKYDKSVPKVEENRWKLEKIDDAKKYGGEIRTLLPRVSDELVKPRTVVVIKNILESDKYLNNALRSWCTNNTILKNHSTVAVFAEDTSIFPEAVWSKMKIIDVPKSLPEEREQIIRESEKIMISNKPDRLDDTQVTAAVRLLAGLNLDQSNAAVVEAIVRDYCIKPDRLASIKTGIFSKNPTLDFIQRFKFGFDEAIGGYEVLKNRLRDDIVAPLKHPEFAEEFCISSPKGVIFFGPPGTGKSIFSKAISREANMSMILLRPENLLSKFVGESERALKGFFKIADNMAPCIVFTDEVDRLGKRTSTSSGDGGAQVHRELFSMFLEKLGDENREWYFIGCTNRIQDIDEAMRRTGRIDSVIPFPYPDEKARRQIFKIHANIRRLLPLADDVDFKVLASNAYTYMWSGSDIEQFVVRTSRYVWKESKKAGKIRKINMDDFNSIFESFNVNKDENERLQEETKSFAKKLTNDTRLMNVFDEAQSVEDVSKAEKAKEAMDIE